MEIFIGYSTLWHSAYERNGGIVGTGNGGVLKVRENDFRNV